MSDDEADPELLELLRKSLGLGLSDSNAPPETGVLESAQHVYNNSIDVALDMRGTKAAAARIWNNMRERRYSMKTWAEHELHPKTKDESSLNFIFMVDLLNFSFWSETKERFGVEYKGKMYKGYWSLCAVIWRALDEGLPITSPSYWHPEAGYSDDVLKHIFRSSTGIEMPMLSERIAILREGASILFTEFDNRVATLIQRANGSAAGLVNLLAEHFSSFRDELKFEGRRKTRFMKRAQIFVADLWACFEGQSHGSFNDIEKITMFADYRIPQILHTLGAIIYSPPLDAAIRRGDVLPAGSTWEIEIRGCTIWVVELIRREILNLDPDAEGSINAILIDFFLYDTMAELEAQNAKEIGKELDIIPHHRTRSIWY